MSSTSQQIIFELPGSSIRGLPLFSETDQPIHLGLVEVSCKPRNKRRQLKDKKQLIYKWWGDTYRKEKNIFWLPKIYRSLIHYHPETSPRLNVKKTELDVVIQYTEISAEMLASLTEEDKTEIYRIVNTTKKRKELLEEIIETRDSLGLHNLIVSGGKNPQIHYLRGKMAEILAQKDLESVLPPGMNCFRNGDIKYFNKRYESGTEIDAILTFYGEEYFIDLVERLRRIDHLLVKDKWHHD